MRALRFVVSSLALRALARRRAPGEGAAGRPNERTLTQTPTAMRTVGLRVLVAVLTTACGARSGLLSDHLDESSANGCEIRVSADRGTPTVITVVDQSESMNETFEHGGSRWDAVRDALFATDGVVREMQSRVSFGLALYSARSQDGPLGGPPLGECPLLTTVTPGLENIDAMSAAFGGSAPIEDTPTADAIDAIVADLPAPAQDRDPVVLVLTTDGEPDTCAELDPQNGQEEAVASVERAFAAGVRTFVVSVGSEISEQHLQDIANAGIGRLADDPAVFWRAGETQGLADALRAIADRISTCVVRLDSEVDPSRACEGTLTVAGHELECGEDGFQPTDRTHLELTGAACDLLSPDASLAAHFPCAP